MNSREHNDANVLTLGAGLIGLNQARMPSLLELVQKCCQPFTQYIPTQLNSQSGYPSMSMIEAQVGGALIYSINVERFEQL